ncbi:putative U6 snRNA-associated Sm-like protein [Drosera capensis]
MDQTQLISSGYDTTGNYNTAHSFVAVDDFTAGVIQNPTLTVECFQAVGFISSWSHNHLGGRLEQLPLSLLKTAQGHPMLVELKNGETYNGHLVNCDTWMNIHLREVICTSKDGDRFWRMPECYIRGNTIKYLRVPDEVIDKVQEETKSRSDRRPPGVGRGRGRGREDGAGRQQKGMGRGMDDGSKGLGRGRGGPPGKSLGKDRSRFQGKNQQRIGRVTDASKSSNLREESDA